MNHYLGKRRLSVPAFWIAVLLALIYCINCGVTDLFAGNALEKKQLVNPDEIEVGEFIHCIEITELKMKSSGEEIKNVVTIYGLVVRVSRPDIFLNVAGTFSSNLRKEGELWVEDHPVVDHTPYIIGNTYAFRFKHEIIDDSKSTGQNQMYFEYP